MRTVGGLRLIVRARGSRGAFLALPLLFAVLAAPADLPAAPGDAQLISHGSSEKYWVVRVSEDVNRGGAYVSDVYARAAGEAGWHQVARVDGRTVQAAHRGSQLALLLDGGGWLVVSEETTATGRPPPPGARILSLASWGDTLVALVRVYDPRTAPSTPATTATASTVPSSRPASPPDSERLALLSLTPQGWLDVGGFDVAGALPGTSADASLGVIEGSPIIAVREGPKTVGVYRHAALSRATTAVNTPTPVVAFKLLEGGPVPVLWTVEADGAARLHWLVPGGVRAVTVDVESGGRRSPASAAHAFDRVRVLYGQGLVLSERTFDAMSGTPSGEATLVRLPRTPVGPPLSEWLQGLLPVLLLFTIISSLRRRREMQETMQEADQLPLAPFGRRLLAGAIDAIPFFAAVGVVVVWERNAERAGDPMFEPRSQVVALVGLIVYLLHTAVSEVAFGRTIGKVVCGLRVVGLDGRRPPAGAMVTRNLLRLIDLSMMFFPLVLVLYSPLRQRAGDVAAGTLVVLNTPGDEPVSDAPAEEAEPVDTPVKEKTAEPAEMAD